MSMISSLIDKWWSRGENAERMEYRPDCGRKVVGE